VAARVYKFCEKLQVPHANSHSIRFQLSELAETTFSIVETPIASCGIGSDDVVIDGWEEE
jgi:hypothetical protein